MPGMIENLQQQLNEFWQGMDSKQKVKFAAVLLLCTFVVVIGAYALSRPKYEVLYPNLSMKDLSDATKKLTDSRIQYKITDDGNGLMVPSKQKNDAKFALADANIPKMGATYSDAMSQTKLGTTESDKTRQYIEFKSQEIANSLLQNSDSIAAAEVFLNIPLTTSFFGEEKKSTASVKITPVSELSPKQIEGIARFVANSVEGLDPKNVEVVDNNMQILKDYDDPTIAGADKQYVLEQTIKKNKEREIREMLANQSSEFDDLKLVLNLKLDFDTEVVDKTIVEPVLDGTGAIVSKSEQVEELQNGTQGGVPGTDSNSGVPAYTGNSSGASSYKNSNVVENYDYNRSHVQTTKAIGQVDKNNSTVAATLFYGNNVSQEPNQQVIDKVVNTISMSTGISTDKISVVTFKLAKAVPAKPSAASKLVPMLQEYGTVALAGILVLLLGAAVFMSTRRYSISKLDNDLNLNLNAAIPQRSLEEIQLEEKSEVKKQIDKFVKQKPEAVASLLRNWLAEDWE